ncbi:MAG TPA: DUF1080 domain-containing protein [Planctomycetota bacterium]|nr:DUF1080 domain-containing protein [Planctomycetota bacterium]
MPKTLILISFFCLSIFAASAGEDEALEPIFNGKDLTGWKVPDPNPFWTVKDGVLVGEETDKKMKGHVLETAKEYGDVIVELEVRWTKGADSGVFLRKGQRWQCQIGDSVSLKKDMTCSLYLPKVAYKAAPAHDVDKMLKVDDWNKIRIDARGPKYKIWLNGTLVNEYESNEFNEPGPIGLQIHGGLIMKVEFRNVMAKALKAEVKPDVAPAVPAAPAPAK